MASQQAQAACTASPGVNANGATPVSTGPLSPVRRRVKRTLWVKPATRFDPIAVNAFDLAGGGIENWFAYMLALVFLLFRPQGLFGERIIERV